MKYLIAALLIVFSLINCGAPPDEAKTSSDSRKAMSYHYGDTSAANYYNDNQDSIVVVDYTRMNSSAKINEHHNKIIINEINHSVKEIKGQKINIEGLAPFVGLDPEPQPNEKRTTILVDKFGDLTLENSTLLCEDLSRVVGHVVIITNNERYDLFPQGLVLADKMKAFQSRVKTPLRSGSYEKEAKNEDVENANLVFLDANLSKEEFYKYTDLPMLSLSANFEEVDQSLVKKFMADKESNTYYMVEAAEVRQITIMRYKNIGKKAKLKSIPFISAIVNGGDACITTKDSDKQIKYKLVVKLAPLKLWI